MNGVKEINKDLYFEIDGGDNKRNLLTKLAVIFSMIFVYD